MGFNDSYYNSKLPFHFVFKRTAEDDDIWPSDIVCHFIKDLADVEAIEHEIEMAPYGLLELLGIDEPLDLGYYVAQGSVRYSWYQTLDGDDWDTDVDLKLLKPVNRKIRRRLAKRGIYLE